MHAWIKLPSRGEPENRRRASLIWKTWLGGVLLLLGAALTPVWLGVLVWAAYQLALAATGIHS
jgi:hypothetical protein